MDNLVCKKTEEVLEAIRSKKKFALAIAMLYLYKTDIGDSGASALSDSLKSNSTLTTLDLMENEIGSSGARALSDSLKSNSTLTALYLYNNEIGDEGAGALSDSLKSNSTLTILKLNSTLTTLDLTTLRLDGNTVGYFLTYKSIREDIQDEIAKNKGLFNGHKQSILSNQTHLSNS